MDTLDEALRAAEDRAGDRNLDDYSVMARAKVRRTAARARPMTSAQHARNGDLLGLVLGVQCALLTFVALLAPRRS